MIQTYKKQQDTKSAKCQSKKGWKTLKRFALSSAYKATEKAERRKNSLGGLKLVNPQDGFEMARSSAFRYLALLGESEPCEWVDTRWEENMRAVAEVKTPFDHLVEKAFYAGADLWVTAMQAGNELLAEKINMKMNSCYRWLHRPEAMIEHMKNGSVRALISEAPLINRKGVESEIARIVTQPSRDGKSEGEMSNV